MISKKLILFGMVSALLFSLTVGHNSIYAAPVTIDIHKAEKPRPRF